MHKYDEKQRQRLHSKIVKGAKSHITSICSSKSSTRPGTSAETPYPNDHSPVSERTNESLINGSWIKPDDQKNYGRPLEPAAVRPMAANPQQPLLRASDMVRRMEPETTAPGSAPHSTNRPPQRPKVKPQQPAPRTSSRPRVDNSSTGMPPVHGYLKLFGLNMYSRKLYELNYGEIDQLARLKDNEAEEICEQLNVFPGHKLKFLRAVDLLRRASEPHLDDIDLYDRLIMEKLKSEEDNKILADENMELYTKLKRRQSKMDELYRQNQELETILRDRTADCEFLMVQLEQLWMQQFNNGSGGIGLSRQSIYDSYDDWSKSATKVDLSEMWAKSYQEKKIVELSPPREGHPMEQMRADTSELWTNHSRYNSSRRMVDEMNDNNEPILIPDQSSIRSRASSDIDETIAEISCDPDWNRDSTCRSGGQRASSSVQSQTLDRSSVQSQTLDLSIAPGDTGLIEKVPSCENVKAGSDVRSNGGQALSPSQDSIGNETDTYSMPHVTSGRTPSASSTPCPNNRRSGSSRMESLSRYTPASDTQPPSPIPMSHGQRRSGEQVPLDINNDDVDTPNTGSPMFGGQRKKLGMSLDTGVGKVYTDCLAAFNVDHLLRCLSKAIQNYIILSQASAVPHQSNDSTLERCKIFLDPICLQKLEQKRNMDSESGNSSHWLNEIVLKRTPNIWVIYNYLNDIMINFKLEPECAVISLIYLKRFMEGSKYSITPDNWLRLSISAMMLASKVWDDESYENNEFAQRCPLYTAEEIGNFEKIFLQCVGYDMSVKSSAYASTYFLLRTIGAKDMPADFNIPAELEPERCARLHHQASTKQLELTRHYSEMNGDDNMKNWTM